MIRILVQNSNRKPTRPQRFAVPCMLRKNQVIPWNSQVNCGETLGEILPRGSKDGMRERYRSVPPVNFS